MLSWCHSWKMLGDKVKVRPTYVLKTPRPTMALLGPQAVPQLLAVL
jgi:hypothetical protein